MKTHIKQKALFSLLLIGILLHPAFTYTFNSYEVKDLWNDDVADEIKSWTVSKAINSKILTNQLDGENYLGGPGVLGTTTGQSGESFARTYKTLPKHNMIYFSLTLAVCGDWNGDGIKLQFDGTTVDRLEFNKKDFVAGKCGAAGAGLTDVVVSGRVPHSMNTLTFKVVSDVKKPSTQASFGIREVSLIFITAATSAVKTDVCCSSASCSALTKNQCSCPPGSYLAASSLTGTSAKCTPGNAYCKTCFGSSASECYSCAKGTYFDGKTCAPCNDACEECTGAGPSKCTKLKQVCIKDSKGNCVDTCPAPLKQDNNAKTCTSTCKLEEFLYPDGSCKSTCDGKEVAVGCYKLCVSQCKVGFATCDGDCTTTCIPPAKIREECGIAYCDWPCPKGEFYWPDNKKDTCVNDCPLPWECGKDSKTNIPICQPKCQPDGKNYVYIKEEDRCDCECPSGFKVEKVQGLFMCMPICPNGKSYWAEGGEGQECVKKCPDGWETKTDKYGNKFCERKCCGDEGIFHNGKCVCECAKGWKTEMVNKVPMCLPLCECGSYWWEEGCEGGPGSCMNKCPEGWEEAKDDCGLDVCKLRCCEEGKETWFEEKGECVCDCPDGWMKAKVNNAWKCVPMCECNEFWWLGGEVPSCVDKCPEGWKCDKGCADIDICSPQCPADANENKWFSAKQECVCDCPAGWIAKDINGVLQCDRACESCEFFWPECSPEGSCVPKCPDGWKAEKGCADVDLCAPQCPCDDEKDTWYAPKEECVCDCPPAWTKAKVNDVWQCVHACDCDDYWWPENGACVCECPEGWQADEGCDGTKICSPKCKPDDEKNIWDSIKGECVCECAPGWVAQEVNGGYQCVRACSVGESWWQDCDGEGACVCECPEGWKTEKGCGDVDICAPQCPDEKDSWFSAKEECVCDCPPGWMKDKVNNVWQCVHACDCDQYWWPENGACVCECPVGWKCDKGCGDVDVCAPICPPDDKNNIFWVEKNECVCECAPGWVAQEVNGGLQCVKVCDKGEFWWQGCDGTESCLCECPEGWKCDKGCEGVDICSPQCPPGSETEFWIPVKQECACECPVGFAQEKINDVMQCVPICEKDEAFWAEGGKNGACIDKCPSGWKCEKGCGDINLCAPQCPAGEMWFDEKHECVCECPSGWVSAEINSVQQCVQSCECGQYWWQECGPEGACVEKCPEGWKCDKGCEDVDICSPMCPPGDTNNIYWGEKGCVCECGPGWVSQEVNNVLQCVEVCECDQLFWADGGEGGACVDKCPDGWKSEKGCEDVDICAPICTDEKNYIFFGEKNECVCECPAGWVKAEINSVYHCVHACDCGQYWWQECGPEGACVEKCPEGWKEDKGCEYADICSPQCPADAPESTWDPVKQECVCECADGYTSTTINGVLQCTAICEPGNYWWNQGGKEGACVCECPSGWTWGTGCGGIDICVPVCDLNCPDSNFFELKSECIPLCPPGTNSEMVNGVPHCVTICPKDELWWCEGSKDGACVCECPVGWKAGEGPGGIPICERQCDASGAEPVFFEEKGICVCECPQGWQIDSVNNALVCGHVCEKGEYWWQAGGKDGACVCDCPEAWTTGVGCDGVDICVPKCDPTAEESILFNGECTCECPCGWQEEKVNDLEVCKKKCPEGQFWWAAAGTCVIECVDGWQCGKDQYGADICVPQCDLDKPEKLWSSNQGQCVCDCAPGFVINTVNRVLACVEACADEM